MSTATASDHPMMMRLGSLFRRHRRRAAVNAAYHRLVERARMPVFFVEWGVPDSFDGRFEVLALHAFLLFQRLRAEHSRTAEFAQDLFDVMFADLDRAVREMGATDVGVGRHVKAMARGFYGRIVAYEHGLETGDEGLEDALRRNLFGTAAPPAPAQLAAAARYLRRQAVALAAVPVASLVAGEVTFAPLDETPS